LRSQVLPRPSSSSRSEAASAWILFRISSR